MENRDVLLDILFWGCNCIISSEIRKGIVWMKERERITSNKQRGRPKKETTAVVADEENEEL